MRSLIPILVLIHPCLLLAQQANPPAPVREGKLEVSMVATSGNARSQSIGLAAEATLRPSPWVLKMQAGFVRNEAEGVVSAKSLRTLARAARVLRPGIEAFGQHVYLRDLFSGVEHRNSIDAGLSYRLIASNRHQLATDAGFGYLREARATDDRLSTALATSATRYLFRVSEASELTDELLFALDLHEDGTWRMNHNAAITAQINSVLALKISTALRFVNQPVEGFGRTDTISSASVVMQF
jgi:putative salt-induced outer membrane protein YdiY